MDFVSETGNTTSWEHLSELLVRGLLRFIITSHRVVSVLKQKAQESLN